MESNKRKEKIKSIAIVFLTVMLILTFFSNTIMNYSLPEVSAQYTASGQIAAKVRGTGVVEAVEPYQVKVTEKRKVEEVLVSSGDTVEKGQVLFRLSESEGSSLSETEEALDAARLEYMQKLYADISQDATEDLTVKNAREDLADAIEKQKNAKNKEKRLEKVEEKIAEAKRVIKDYEAQVNAYEKRITALSGDGGEDLTAYETAVENAQTAVISWENMISDVENQIEEAEYNLSVAKASKEYWEKVDEGEEEPPSNYNGDIYDKLEKLNKQIRSLESSITSLNTQKIEYKGQLNKANQVLERAKTALEKAKKEIKNTLVKEQDVLKEELSSYEEELERLQAKETEIKTDTITEDEAEAKVKTAERALEAALAEYSKNQSTKKGQQAIAALELEVIQKKVKKLEDKLAKLKGKTEGYDELTASVAGVISAVNCVAGEEVTSENPLATIQIVEKGYRTSLTVTNEQSKKVKEGDRADVLNIWGQEMEVILTKIASDSANPGQSKILTFRITGDAQIGQSLDLSVGEKSINYDTIVPNSAVHEDSKGKFVLVTVVKSTPLGNRYIASRVNVEVLAADENNSAVSGDLSGSDFVITASTKPIEAGMQVRLMEGGDIW